MKAGRLKAGRLKARPDAAAALRGESLSGGFTSVNASGKIHLFFIFPRDE